MNRDEILAMEPGRELDALVAEKVVGYVVNKDWFEWCYDATDEYRYSTDISAAWEVFCLWDIPKVNKWFDPDDNEWFTCIIGTDHVVAKTAPEAICKAALLAVMEE